MARLLAAALGILVLAVWALGVGYGAAAWLTWGNFAAGVLVLASLGTVRAGQAEGIATWPLAGMVLVALWLFGLRARGSHLLGWADLVLGAGFLALTIATLTEGTAREPHARKGSRYRVGSTARTSAA